MLSYNRPEFVRPAIETCVGNAEYPLELIVHDDGSSPDTVEVLMELRSAGLISLLMLNAEGNNEGQGIALNRMFAAAKGDPIVKLDHDLVFEPGWLRKSVEVLVADEKRWSAVPSEDAPRIGALGLFHYHADPVKASEMFVATHSYNGLSFEEHRDFVGSAMVIPCSAWRQFGPFEERSPAFAEDAIFKKDISDEPWWCCGLLPEDLVRNVGFGPGPSTIVSLDHNNEVVVAEINDGPKLVTHG